MVTVVIPTYNERENIAVLIGGIFSAQPDARVLVVDDSSPDGTADVVRGLMRTHAGLDVLVRPAKEGLGRAYVDAFRFVLERPDVQYIITMDADGSHDPSRIGALVERSGTDAVAIGSRYVASGRTQHWELWRQLLSRGGNYYSRLVTGLPIHDCTAGFMCIPAAYLRDVQLHRLHASGYAFLIELKCELLHAGAQLKEVPITFANRRYGSSKLSSHIISEGIVAPWLLRVRRWWRH